MENSVFKKCPNCGESVTANARFCSVCGTSLASFCPNCGTAHEKGARFCTNCGYAFAGETVAPVRQPSVVMPVTKKVAMPTKGTTGTGRLGKALRIIPAVLFALFAVLTFVFYCAPMVKMPFLGSMGNLYQFLGGDEALEMFGLQGLAITYLLLSVAILVIGIVYLCAVIPYGKRKLVSAVLSWAVIGIYLVFLIISIVFSVSAQSEIESSSSVATLLIVFSIIFALLSGTCNALCFTRLGAIPALKQTDEKPVTEKIAKEAKKPSGVLGKVLRIIPAGLFALFAVLTFAFYCAPMVKMPFLGSMGNLYQFLGEDEMLKAFGLQGLSVAYIILSVVALCIGILYLLAVTPYGRRLRARNELFLSDVLSWLVIGMYVTFFIVSIVVLSTLAKEEMDLSSSVATLFIVFSIIFTLLSGTCNALCFTRFGARWAMPKAMRQPVPPTEPVVAKIKEEGEAETVTEKYLKSVRGTAKFVVWMVFFAVYPIFGVLLFKIFGVLLPDDYSGEQFLLVFVLILLAVLGLPIILSLLMNKIASPLKPYRTYRITKDKHAKRWAIFIGVVLGLWTIETIGITCAMLSPSYQYDDIVWEIAMEIAIWIFEIFWLCAFFALLGLRRKRKKTLRHPAVKPLSDLCTEKNMEEMALYLKAVKRYTKEEKLYAFYLYDKEKCEKYLTYMHKA